MSTSDLTALQESIGYQFRNSTLLEQALSHSSLKQQRGRRKNTQSDNERLEFLGDSVLGMIIAALLFHEFPNEKEGELARRHAALVCGNTTVQVAQTIELGKYLRLSQGEANSGGRETASNLEDACEALIGAVYLDGGYKAAEAVVLRFWKPLSREIQAPPKDPKSGLQEWAQQRGLPLPEYQIISSDGPDHAPRFEVEVRVSGYPPALAEGRSKRLAEREAAKKLLNTLTRKNG